MKPRLPSRLACRIVALYLAAGLPAGCAYRFTNDHIVRPEGIKSVAVEAVYDTSREVLPHETLWQALQDAFAASGYVRLAPQASADAIVRAHIKTARVVPAGEEVTTKPIDDPDISDDETPVNPKEFRVLTQAGEMRDKGRLTMSVEVEVWSLRTRTLLMRKTYPLAGIFQAIPDVKGGVTQLENGYLRNQEALEARFEQMSKSLSQAVVRDLFVQ